TTGTPSRLSRTSHSMPNPPAIAASKAAMPFSLTLAPCSPRWAKGRSVRKANRSGVRPDKDDRIDLDGGIERQHRHAHRAARMAARIAKDIDHQFRRAIGDFRLVAEVGRAADEDAQLHDPLHAVQAA